MSFRLKTILGIGLIEVLMLSVLVISGLHYLRESNERQLIDRADNLARLFATMTADAVVALDLATIDVMIDEALKNRGISYVRVRHVNGKVLGEGGDEAFLRRPFTADGAFVDMDDDGLLDLSHPIEIAGRTFGRIELGIDVGAIAAAQDRARRWMLGVAGIEVLLVALFSFMLGTMLTRQLQSLRSGARQVAQGNFGFQIEASGKDELADTAASFNAMSSELAVYSKRLEEERARAEAGRVRAESTLEDAIDSLSEGILIADSSGRVLHMNEAFRNLYGDDGAMIVGADHMDAVKAMTRPLIVEREIFGAETAEPGAEPQTTLVLRDGRRILHSHRPMASGGDGYINTDLTAHYSAPERAPQLVLKLMQAQKLESLGTLAGGIAHEINTPIQYIGDNLRFLEQSCEDFATVIDAHVRLADAIAAHPAGAEPEIATAVAFCRAVADESDVAFLADEAPLAARQSSEGVEQVAGIVRAMKEFSHPTSKEMAPLDLNRVIERATMVCRNEWKHCAELELSLDDRLPQVPGLEGELNQVVLNLVVNAAHAIVDADRGRGRISISTGIKDGNVMLTIADNGTGIPAAVGARIFEPFFTTKDVGKGTGQGLAIAHDIIVSRHGGSLDFETRDGEGTIFRIVLPLNGADAKASLADSPAEMA